MKTKIIENMSQVKFEKTCRCMKELSRQNDNDSSKVCEFHKRREYQVDVYFCLEKSHYKVYQNGGWNDFVFLDEDEFKENFEMIL